MFFPCRNLIWQMWKTKSYNISQGPDSGGFNGINMIRFRHTNGFLERTSLCIVVAKVNKQQLITEMKITTSTHKTHVLCIYSLLIEKKKYLSVNETPINFYIDCQFVHTWRKRIVVVVEIVEYNVKILCSTEILH